jgi:hypothetical protein
MFCILSLFFYQDGQDYQDYQDGQDGQDRQEWACEPTHIERI